MNKELLDKIADKSALLMVRSTCFDFHFNKKAVLYEMADLIDDITELYADLLINYEVNKND